MENDALEKAVRIYSHGKCQYFATYYDPNRVGW